MPKWLRSLAVAAVVLALLPAAAVAQSAGDEQYADPFGGKDQTQTKTKTKTQAQATPAPSQAAPTSPAPAAEPAQAPTTAPQAPSAAQAQLPRTGADAWLPALVGLALLSAGVALRARARRAS